MEENELRAFVCVRDAAMKNEGSRSVDGEAEVPTPRVFFVRVANKGVRVDAASMNVTPLETEGLEARGDIAWRSSIITRR
jgi:hypothetical protein